MNKKQYEKPVMRIVEQRLTTYLQTTSAPKATKNNYTEDIEEGTNKSLSDQIWGNN